MEKLCFLYQNKTRRKLWYCPQPLISNIVGKLKKTIKRTVMPKYNVGSISDGIKVHIQDRFCTVKLN